MKFSLLFVAVFASLLLAFAKGEDVCASSSAENPITHFFVLMMENRSFDHFLVSFSFVCGKLFLLNALFSGVAQK